MRQVSQYISDTWNSGNFVGDNRPHSRVTVQIGYSLQTSTPGQNVGTYTKIPVRWFQPCDTSVVETEVPNIKSIKTDRSLSNDAATAEIVLYNQNMYPFTGAVISNPDNEMGAPGWFSFGRSLSNDDIARWKNHFPNSWFNVLVPNALIRSYSGFGGNSKTIPQAVTDGNIICTGTWLVDEVLVNTDGTLTLKCRDMAKLLIQQHLYPPLVPASQYPLLYHRWDKISKTFSAPPNSAPAQLQYQAYGGSLASGSDVWYGANASVHGHRPTDAFDQVQDSFWLSVGNISATAPFALEWIEMFLGGQNINTVTVTPWSGPYAIWLSVWSGAAWVDPGNGVIPYNAAGIGKYTGANTANIPFVLMAGAGPDSPTTFTLPQTYQNVQKIRVSMSNLVRSQWGPYYFRSGVRELGASAEDAGYSYTQQQTVDGNYTELSQIIKDLLLWSGWWCSLADYSKDPTVWGNIETTGTAFDDPIPDEIFDKVPVIDAINALKVLIGYEFMIAEDGKAIFRSPNFWSSGNFIHETGAYTPFIPVVDEKQHLITYGVDLNDKDVFSNILVTTNDIYKLDPALTADGANATVTAQYTPPFASALKGMVRTSPIAIDARVKPDEAYLMAELFALYSFFSQRTGQINCVANPALQLGDQIRIFERLSGETFIHRIVSISTTHDLDSGEFTSNIGTNWLGDETTWAFDRNNIDQFLQAYMKRINARSTAATSLNAQYANTPHSLQASASHGSNYSQIIIGYQPVAYWRLGETSGIVAADSSGNRSNGTYINTPTLGVVGAVSADTAVTFVSSMTEYATTPFLNIAVGDFTILAWVNVASSAATQIIYAESTTTGGIDLTTSLSITSHKTRLTWRNAAGTAFTTDSTTSVDDGTWHLAAGTRTGTTLQVYFDGVAQGTPTTISGANPTLNIGAIGAKFLGVATPDGTSTMNGTEDEVTVLSRSLPASEILTIFRSRS